MPRSVAVLVLCGLLAGAAVLFWPRPAVPPTLPEPPPPPVAGEIVPAYPVTPPAGEPAPPDELPLPALEASDAAFQPALVAAAPGLDDWLVPDGLIRRLVVTVDNLAREQVAVEQRPLAPAPESFRVLEAGDGLVISPENYARYQPVVNIVAAADLPAVVAVYRRFYPLFQQAYEELGYPDGYFNDRLIAVIDSLLATPDVTGPVAVVRPKVMYRYADPALEALPAGQKLLLRIGPQNRAVVRERLQALRGLLVGG